MNKLARRSSPDLNDFSIACRERLLVKASHGCAVLRVGHTLTAPHAQWGVALIWGVERDVCVEHAGGVARGRLVVVPAGATHVTRSAGPLLSIVLDADDHRAAAWSAGTQPWASDAAGERAGMLRLFEGGRHQMDSALTLAGAVLPTGPRTLGDSRIAAAVQMLAADDGAASPLVRLSKALRMSPAYLSTLFHKTMGISLRRWLLWRRVRRSLLAMEPGRLAACAMTAGFADQAHLTRSMRRLVGYTPGFFAGAA
jgi:AraC-like DNA-binding protein